MNVAELHRQIEALKDRLFKLIEGKQKVEPAKAKHRGPDIELNSRAHARWMEQLLGKKENKEAGQKRPGKRSRFIVQDLRLGVSPKAEGILYRKALRANGLVGPGYLVAWRACADCFRSHSVASVLDIRLGATPCGQSQPNRAA